MDKVNPKRGVLHWLRLILLSIMLIGTTPLFYIIHGFVRFICNNTVSKDLMEVLDLPYIFALLSNNLDMITLFHNHGVFISNVDGNGNNIFHYLTDLAIQNNTKACSLLEMVIQYADDTRNIVKTLMVKPNKFGITALDYMAQRGTFSFMKAVVQYRGLYCKSSTSVKNGLMCKLPHKPGGDRLCEQSSQSHDIGATNMIDVDITDLDWHNYGIFRGMIECQHLGDKCEQEMQLVKKWPFLKKWCTSKLRMFLPIMVFRHIFEICFTLLLIFYMWQTGGDHNAIPLAKSLKVIFDRQQSVTPSVSNVEAVMLSAIHFTNDLNSTESCPGEGHKVVPFGPSSVTVCLQRALDELQQVCGSKLDITNLLKYSGIDTRNNEMLQFVSYYTKVIHVIFFCAALFHLCMDVLFRLQFLFVHMQSRYNMGASLMHTFIHTKFPGSYVSKQFLVLSYTLVLGYYIVIKITYYMIISPEKRQIDDNLYFFDLMSYIMVTCLIARGLYHIHALRLFPSIGQFVIAMFKMAETLLDFSIVYVSVMSIFAIIFHFLMRQENCPALRKPGFENLRSSMFYTFKLLNKHANFTFPNINAIIIVTYVCYTFICCLLLLNLLIATMKITCARILKEPWTSFLQNTERINEAINIECDLWFVKRLMSRRWINFMSQRGGFCVEKTRVTIRAYEDYS